MRGVCCALCCHVLHACTVHVLHVLRGLQDLHVLQFLHVAISSQFLLLTLMGRMATANQVNSAIQLSNNEHQITSVVERFKAHVSFVFI